MNKSAKSKIANSLGANQNLNKKALNLKSSWDSVDKLLKNTNIANKKSKTGKSQGDK